VAVELFIYRVSSICSKIEFLLRKRAFEPVKARCSFCSNCSKNRLIFVFFGDIVFV
jgi:hypothetical protein